MKGQNDGVKNEKQIVEAFDKKRIDRLSDYAKSFIKQLFPNASDSEEIHAEKVGGQGFKPDVCIEVAGEKRNISVKKGGGNSVHQEKTEYFINYCKQNLGMTDEEAESLLMFLYGDGTIDGDSEIEERLKDKALVETFKEQIKIVQNFLNKNKRSLLERFLIYGRKGKQKNIKADYLYHGDVQNGKWCPLDVETLDYLVGLPNSQEAPLSIGPLTIQVWNRNLEGNPRMESRRHSIQVKWGSCKSYIDTINKIPREYVQKEIRHVLGDNSQGFENQEKIIKVLNNSRVYELPTALKNIVIEMYPNVASSEIVKAYKITDNDIKPKISVCINGETKYLSVFMGNGNGVHQENINTFIPFCKEKLGMTDSEEESFRYIIYADGTTDGNSKAEDRLGDTLEIKEKYAKEIRIVQNFIDRNRRELVERFLMYGKAGKEKNIKSEYIYYGTNQTGRLLPYSEVVKFIVEQENSKSALLSIGPLTLQTWNRNLRAIPEYEKKRNSLQVKWGKMKNSLNQIREQMEVNKRGTADGDWEEYELVSKLNRDKNLSGKLWKSICDKLEFSNLDEIFAVRVSNLVNSKLSGRLVLPKADVYLVKGNINHQVLLDNNYWLDEDIIKNYDVKPIRNSGISCKRPNSKNFTYVKLTVNSFIELFNDSLLGAGISIFVKESELSLNNNVVKAWGSSEKMLLERFEEELRNRGGKVDKTSLMDVETCKIIKHTAIGEMAKIIKATPDIRETIFYGKTIFEEPYSASFTYINGKMSESHVPQFSISTGSGRHRGIYTIVVKP